MKKTLVVMSIVAVVMAVMAVPVLAAPGGAPAAHGVDGKTFGAAVSGLAQSAPGAVAAHVSGGNSGGAPAAHGLSGAEFGAAVSSLAQSAPGAVAAHVSGK
jgi:hypothetical protein